MADETPTVRVEDNRARRRFEAFVGTALAGFITYEVVPGGLVFVHTETEPGFEGRGVAGHLAGAALDEVRVRGLHVTPRCPFVASYIERHPEYADLVADPASRRPS
jgi:predicted GNAT family acetyltransferase